MLNLKQALLLSFLVLSGTSVFGQNKKVGINTATPTNTLHIIPQNNDEPLKVEGLKPYIINNDTVLLITNPSTGVVRHIPIKDLINNYVKNDLEWIDGDQVQKEGFIFAKDALEKTPSDTIAFDDHAGFYLGTTENRLGVPVTGYRILKNYSISSGVGNIANSPFSVASGVGNFADGFGATAGGENNRAENDYCIAGGKNNVASGYGSVAIGLADTSRGILSFAYGEGNKSNGRVSVAFGKNNSANGSYSLALGEQNITIGWYSLTTGVSNTANGSASFVFGNGNTANGTSSLVGGTGNSSSSATEVVLGTYAATTPNRALGFGIGINNENRKDAFTILKNGNIGFGVEVPQRTVHIKDVMRLEPSATPTTPSKGDIYFDSTSNKARCFDGTVWQDLW